MNQNAFVAAALGREIWSTDLFIPQYKSGEIGEWRLMPGGQLVNDWGYFSGHNLVQMLPALARRKADDKDGWEVWMSLTPHEIESQELGCRYAYGEVVVMGLGMGWIAANIALNPKVTGVTIVELDPRVIDLFHKSGACDSLPQEAKNKLTIVNESATEWKPETPKTIQFLYADIWLGLAEPQTLSQMRRMQENLQAESIYYWGQEIAIHCAVKELGEELNAESIERALQETLKLPLLVPGDRDYAEMIKQVIANRIERQLPIEIPLD